jgi:hypothetical protein
MISKKQFSSIIKRASQPLKSSEKKENQDNDGGYTDKRIRQRNTEDTLEKQHDESR